MSESNNKKFSYTEFFVEIEKKWLDHWYKTGIIDKYLHKNDDSSEYFSFLDGPITANNPMGVHHAWGRTYKDLWQKFHNLLGRKQRFQNGFDCQGLWVEVEVEKELGLKTKKDIENLVPGDKNASIAKFVQLCKDRVIKFSGIQTEQSKRLGYFMDWEHSYFTMSDDNNYMIWHFLKTCFEHGWIYKGHESVPWCPRCETAISQHEMLTEDYKEVEHETIYLELPIINNAKTHNDASLHNNEYLLIWTTTPWTIPANIAVAVSEDMDYSLVKGNTGDTYWVAKDTVERIFGKKTEIIKTVKGSELVGLKYKGPFDHLPAVKEVADKNPDTFHTVVATDDTIMPISAEEGTGLVHTAVSAGTEDFKLGKKLGLPMIPVIADNADYLPGLDFLSGKNAKQNPRVILDYLEDKDSKGENWVFKIEKYKHRYPGCWRCKEELVWKVADEWYIAMDKPSKRHSEEQSAEESRVKDKTISGSLANAQDDKRTLRERMIDVAKKITWMPSFGLQRELDWLNNMHDWLISKKNRYWGLSLPIYECEKCGTFEVIGSKQELKERAVEGWEEFEGHSPHKPYIDEVKIKCSQCDQVIHRVDDVGNPWLDAGIVPYSTMKKDNQGEPLYLSDREEWKKWFPADFITESFPGQFKNWFYAMIAMSTVLEDTNPYKRVLGFGTLLGEDGRPMHKSWGNSIAFHEGADEIGVDVMRWMYARHNPAENLLFGYKKADEVRRQFYLLLWNVYKYYRNYSELDEFKPKVKKDKLYPEYEVSHILDYWIIQRSIWLSNHVKKSLLEYNSQTAAAEIESFVNDVSTWYIRRSRDRVGVSSKDTQDKESFYNTLYNMLVSLSITISPILPFISEEIYTQLTGKESVHLENWPEHEEQQNNNVVTDMELVRSIAEVGNRVRKELQLKLRQPLASVTVLLPKNAFFLEKKYENDYLELIKEELNVKKVLLKTASVEEIDVEYDTELTDELKLEGEVRDLVRQIQNKRKQKGADIKQKITLTMPEKFKDHEAYIKQQVQAEKVNYGDTIEVLTNE